MGNATGWIGDHQLRAHAIQETLHIGRIGGIAAQDPVRFKLPGVAHSGDRLRGNGRCGLFI
jgi:hypothetical protein